MFLTSSCKIETISCIKSHEDWFKDGILFDEGAVSGTPAAVIGGCCWDIDSTPVKLFIFCF